MNNTDWSATGAWMQAWAGFAGAGAVVYAAYKGAATYRRWLTEKQTERHLAVAERVLALAYSIKRALPAIRSPMRDPSEIGAAEKKLRENYEGFNALPDDQRKRLNTAQVTYTRLAHSNAEWAELFACLPLAKAYFGDDVEKQLERLWSLQAQVRVSAEMYGDPIIEKDFRKETERVLWDFKSGSPEAGDPINVALAEVIALLESRLLPLLRSDGGVPSKTGSGKTAKR